MELQETRATFNEEGYEECLSDSVKGGTKNAAVRSIPLALLANFITSSVPSRVEERSVGRSMMMKTGRH